MKQKLTYLILCLLLCGISAYAQKKTFVRDYTYQASEADSKLTARANATTQMRNILLRELGEFLHTERTLSQNAASQDYSEKIEAITAGIVEMKTLDEQWNMEFSTYYIKAEMTVDPKDLERRIAEVLNDKQKTKDLEEARKRTLAAEAETARLKKELEKSKNEQQRLALKKKYQQSTEVLSAEEYFTRGYNAQENGWHEMAIEYYQMAIAANPNDTYTYYNMGNAYANLQDYQEAIRCYKKAIAIDPNDAYAYNNMGVAYNNLQDYQEAIRCYKKAIAIDPNHTLAHRNMGLAYYGLQNYQEAIQYWKKTIAIDPNNAAAYYYMGYTYANLEDYQEAIRCYKKVIDIDQKNADAYRNMGYAYSHLKNYEEAIRCHQKIIAIDPNDAGAYYSMGYAYKNLKNYQEAIRCFQKAIDINPDNYGMLFSIARVKDEMGDRRGAIKDYDKLIANRASIDNQQFLATIYNNKAFGLINLGEYQAALPVIEEALLLEKGLSFIWDTKGELYYHLKRYEECIELMNKAISITDTQWAADTNNHDNSYYYRGLAKIKLNKRTEGVQDIKKAAQLGHEKAQEWLQKGGYSW